MNERNWVKKEGLLEKGERDSGTRSSAGKEEKQRKKTHGGRERFKAEGKRRKKGGRGMGKTL